MSRGNYCLGLSQVVFGREGVGGVVPYNKKFCKGCCCEVKIERKGQEEVPREEKG